MNTSEQPVEFVSNPIENMTPTLDSNSSDISFNSASSENSPQLDVNADSSPTFLVGVDAVKGKIDYKKLITLFGCQEIDEELVKRIERLTKMPAHPFLKRGLFFSHRDLDVLLDAYEAGKKFYMYTGIGPSSDNLHLGHMMPFMFTKYLQDSFKAIVVIQITTDEKYIKNPDFSMDHVNKMAKENIKDIIACGFDPKLTFIFSNFDYIGHMYPTICSIQRTVTYNQARAIFGLIGSDNLGKTGFAAVQAAPAFPSSFRDVLPKSMSNARCLIPCGIDQDPYFRMARDAAPKLKAYKPVLMHSKFLPSLLGIDAKMSSSNKLSAIFMSDTAPMIRSKIMKHAFSGGAATPEEHRKCGANLEVDVSFQYLRVFLDSDDQLKQIETSYGSGEMLTGPMKQILVSVLTKIVGEHQERRRLLTDEVLTEFMAIKVRGLNVDEEK